MKTLVMYYSYNGNTRALAQAIAKQREADLVEVKDKKRPSLLGTFIPGCPRAMGLKPGKVQPFTADYAAYDRVVVMGPIWASHPAPPVNNILEALPKGTQVELVFTSGGSGSEKEKVSAKVAALGLELMEYRDEKTGVGPNGAKMES